MRWRSRTAIVGAVAVVGAILLTGALSGCTGDTRPTPSPSDTATLAPSPTPSAMPSAPTLEPKGSAAQNLPYFDYVNQRVLASNPSPVGMDFINALAAAGFDKADMQVTADKTTVGLTPGSIQFSVRFRGECLIGQNGAGSDGYHSQVAPLLSTGKCLIGNTVPIPQ